ncbi:MAG: SAM-dependent methyltransferase [Clostridia bacterium]|nr:SAM-dependent methyltransferase [Clostridia bacterium]
MKNITLSKRLSAAAELCRDGSFIADVGTDHAYLPIYLAKCGKIRGGVASDINKGPIDRARAHIAENGLSDVIETRLCDGLSELSVYAPDDIFILGMGGELIARIIENAPFVKNKNIRLILQPMTHSEILRKSLLDGGFSITVEKLVKEEKIYRIIVAEYSGERSDYTDVELTFGRQTIEERSPLFFELLDHTERVMNERICGKRISGADTSEEEKMLGEIEKIRRFEDTEKLK